MLISVRDWRFDVDIPMNMEISADQASEHLRMQIWILSDRNPILF